MLNRPLVFLWQCLDEDVPIRSGFICCLLEGAVFLGVVCVAPTPRCHWPVSWWQRCITLSQSAQAAHKTPWTAWLKQQHGLSYRFGGWEVRGHGDAQFSYGEGSLPGLPVATFSLCPHVARKRE